MMKMNSAKVLSIGVTVLGIISTILSNMSDEKSREGMKEELKTEIIKELSNK